MQKTLVIVPTYNNPKTIKAVVKDLQDHNYKIIVVDDGSEKSIEDMFEKNEIKNVHFLRHETNTGKGSAIISGVKKAKELGYTHAGSIDGDGQHLAQEMVKLTSIYEENTILIGARNLDMTNVPFVSKFGRWFSNFWAKWDTGYEINDSLSGYRIYPVSILDLEIKTSRFDWEMEVLVRHADSGKVIKEALIECYYPNPEDRVSHFTDMDTLAIVWVHVQILPFKWLKSIKNKLLGR
ncbi:FIG143263: Glycosyl transferase [hydrothermal vent metagenome]|uniref:FIG143263: Glycosyl transferase n=1 Tax=hydrothermal vent metagenome TaxID=652676 RepID=A0A1W1CRM2_9ZZZZ